MPEVVLVRLTGAREFVAVPAPLPDTLTVYGVRYVYNRSSDLIRGRPRYAEAPEEAPAARLCLHGVWRVRARRALRDDALRRAAAHTAMRGVRRLSVP